MSFNAGTYIIRPQNSNGQALLIGPVPLIWPPLDVPVRVAERPIDRWIIRSAENNTFTVFAGNGNPNDYKWIIKDNALFVSSISPPDSFRFESAGGGLWTIGIFGKDSLLTFANGDNVPQLTFKPANGSPAQHFEVIRIDRD